MHDDVKNLRDFYATPLGQLARRIITRRVRERWANVRGMNLVGLGYASPYLRVFNGEARVPFQPRGDKPVYCSDCFETQRGATRTAPRGSYR